MLFCKPFRHFPFINCEFAFTNCESAFTFKAIIVARSRSCSRSCSLGTGSVLIRNLESRVWHSCCPDYYSKLSRLVI